MELAGFSLHCKFKNGLFSVKSVSSAVIMAGAGTEFFFAPIEKKSTEIYDKLLRKYIYVCLVQNNSDTRAG